MRSGTYKETRDAGKLKAVERKRSYQQSDSNLASFSMLNETNKLYKNYKCHQFRILYNDETYTLVYTTKQGLLNKIDRTDIISTYRASELP
jgi:hypothetical protein